MGRCTVAIRFALRALVLAVVAASAAAQGAQPREPVEQIRVASDYQGWVDGNRNGLLEPPEIEELLRATTALLVEPHPGRSPVDGMFDLNENGRIDLDELMRARMEFFRVQLMRLPEQNPELARLVDVRSDGRIDEDEAMLAMEYLFVDRRTQEPHRSEGPLDERVDRNRDGRVDERELNEFRGGLIRAVALMPFAPARYRELARGEPSRELPAALPGGAAEQPPAQEKRAQPQAAGASTAAAGQQTATASAAVAVAAPAGDLELSGVTFDEIFPVFHKYYDDHPIGKATLANGLSVAVDKISVQLIVKDYMADKKACKGPDRLEPGESKDVELYALFSEKEVLAISEGTKALATISVVYTAGGQTKTKETTGTVRFLERNAMTWDDNDRAAAFVTAKDTAVLKLAKSTVGVLGRAVASKAVDANLLVGMGIHEALALYGLSYVVDARSSYQTMSASASTVDSLQFPQQTLEYKAGDCDDLSILTAALLEAVGVDSAFVTVPGHIYLAFALTMAPAEARATFLKPDELIYKADKAWVPVEVTSIDKGFLKAWEEGAKEWRENDARNQTGFYPIQDAWKKYEPVAYSTGTLSLTPPDETALAKAYADEVTRFIDREIAERVLKLQADIKKDQEKPATINKLGVLYARYGLSERAQKEFERILAKTEFAPALVNLGNLAFLSGDAKKALTYYDRAQKLEPEDPKVLLCIARANHELENYGTVRDAYDKLKTVDASLAAQFAYLDLRGSEATRAADIGGLKGTVVWDEP